MSQAYALESTVHIVRIDEREIKLYIEVSVLSDNIFSIRDLFRFTSNRDIVQSSSLHSGRNSFKKYEGICSKTPKKQSCPIFLLNLVKQCPGFFLLLYILLSNSSIFLKNV